MKILPEAHSTSNLTLEIARAILAEAAKRPWLASLLLRRKEWLSRLAERLNGFSRQTRRILRRALNAGMAAAVLAATFLWASPAHAGTIIVDGFGCTLEDAITTANSNIVTGGCFGGSAGADTIDLQTDVTLNSALPDISSEITIEGNGHTIERDSAAGANFGVLTVTSSGNLTLKQATISGGVITGNGGGIYSKGTLTVEDSTITGNSASLGGGGVCAYGSTVTIKNSTISGNSTSQIGGGVLAYGTYSGGWVYATANIENSTITGNTASMGGGIFGTTANVYVKNSIVAENTIDDCGYNIGTFTSQGYNIESGSYCNFTGTGDQQHVSDATIVLGSLADNGGPTYTHALGSSSVAIDKIPDGANGCVTGTSIDQRGAVRANGSNKGGSGCDVGAYEYDSNQTPTALTLNNLSASIHSPTGIIAALSAAFVALGAGWLSLFRHHKAQG